MTIAQLSAERRASEVYSHFCALSGHSWQRPRGSFRPKSFRSLPFLGPPRAKRADVSELS